MSGLLIKREPLAQDTLGYMIVKVGLHSCKVSNNEYDNVNHYHWRPKRKKKKIYAVRRFTRNGKTYEISMHRQIMGSPPGIEPHHKNHDTLDNRRENLENVPHNRHPH